MIPSTNNVTSIQEVEYPTRTYKLDITNKRISGYVDELEAMKQAIYKSILTQRYSKIIYDEYGTDIETLIGQDPDFVLNTIEDRIEDSLLSDTRITSIDNFVGREGDAEDAFTVSFTAQTIYGEVPIIDLEV